MIPLKVLKSRILTFSSFILFGSLVKKASRFALGPTLIYFGGFDAFGGFAALNAMIILVINVTNAPLSVFLSRELGKSGSPLYFATEVYRKLIFVALTPVLCVMLTFFGFDENWEWLLLYNYCFGFVSFREVYRTYSVNKTGLLLDLFSFDLAPLIVFIILGIVNPDLGTFYTYITLYCICVILFDLKQIPSYYLGLYDNSLINIFSKNYGLSLHKAFQWTLSSGDRLIILHTLGKEALGKYAIVYQFISLIQIFTTSKNKSLFARSWRTQKRVSVQSKHLSKREYAVTLTPILVLCLVYYWFEAKELPIDVFLLTLVLGVSFWFHSMYLFYSSYFIQENKHLALPKITFISGISALTLFVILIPSIGIMGAAIGTLIGYLIMYVLSIKHSK